MKCRLALLPLSLLILGVGSILTQRSLAQLCDNQANSRLIWLMGTAYHNTLKVVAAQQEYCHVEQISDVLDAFNEAEFWVSNSKDRVRGPAN